jgi:hypothetical protein
MAPHLTTPPPPRVVRFDDAYAAIEEHSAVDGWHFEVNMEHGLKMVHTPYVSALGAFWPALQVPIFPIKAPI